MVKLTFILHDHTKPFEFRGKTYTSRTGFFGVEVEEEEVDSVIEESRKNSDYLLVKDSRDRFDISSMVKALKKEEK